MKTIDVMRLINVEPTNDTHIASIRPSVRDFDDECRFYTNVFGQLVDNSGIGLVRANIGNPKFTQRMKTQTEKTRIASCENCVVAANT